MTPEVPAQFSAEFDAAREIRERLSPLPDLPASQTHLEQSLVLLCVCSPYLRERSLLHPQDLASALALVDAEPADMFVRVKRKIDSLAEQVIDTNDAEEAFMAGLRSIRHQEILGIIIRDLCGLSDLTQILQSLSDLADACISGSVEFIHQQLVSRFGEPCDSQGQLQRLIVICMGKLGGHELNFSSDIDLICCFRSAGQTNGMRSLDNSEFFKRHTQALARILGRVTAHGFVFRVDLRLRPFGESGPLVMNFDGLENYYLTQGREWERYALIKARPICGTAEDREALVALLNPFVYRRYLDYGAFESLRDLKSQIELEVRRKGMEQNIKLGPGGIREIEFIAQALQLVRGGREPALQQRSLLQILSICEQMGLLDASVCEGLASAYDFLRRTENRLQMMRDQQVHTIPEDEDDRTRLRIAMGFDSWSAFAAELAVHRRFVRAAFKDQFQSDKETDIEDIWVAAWTSSRSADDWLPLLTEHDFEAPDSAAADLYELRESVFYSSLASHARQRIDRLMPEVLRSVQTQGGQRLALQGLLALVRRVAGRSGYLQVLTESTEALRLLTRIFGKSSFVADFVCAHPIVIDEFLHHSVAESRLDYQSLEHELRTVIRRVKDQDLEIQMDGLRQFKQGSVMHVAAAELENKISLMQVSDRLSWIADLTLQAVSDLVWQQLMYKHGEPVCIEDGIKRKAGFAIVAYGKLGGLELGYASDLDIVFLHDSAGEQQQTDGLQPIENSVFFSRLARKIIHFLTTTTATGVLYPIDTRLRPDGQAGLLVSSVTAYQNYQEHNAWTWEHQALVRARVSVGGRQMRRWFGLLRERILRRSRDPEKLCREVAEMRARMRSALAGPAGKFDLKQDSGGIADIEFMVQYAVLAEASRTGDLVLDTDNFRLLTQFGKLGIFSVETANNLRDVYLEFRRYVHQQALLEKPALIDLADELTEQQRELLQQRAIIQQLWQEIME